MNWQVYVKQDGYWITWGEPEAKTAAEALVQELLLPVIEEQKKKLKKSKLRYQEPHCVPI